MAPSSSPDVIAHADGERLLDLAEAALDAALAGRRPQPPRLSTVAPALREPGEAFVTLHVAGALNGCIGSLDGDEPLAHAVGRLALAAAFHDPRLPVLEPADRADLSVEISLLSPRTPIEASDHEELAEALRPGLDGVVVQAGHRRGLFLPDVWQQLPHPVEFLTHLWRKAGLRPGSWPPGLEASRFVTQRFERRSRPTRAAG